MPRPTITGETIVVQVENDLVVWTDGLISSDNKTYVKRAQLLSLCNTPVNLTPFGPEIKANLDDKNHPEQALAAIMGIVPGRARILNAPKTVINLLPFPDETEHNNQLTKETNIWVETPIPEPDQPRS